MSISNIRLCVIVFAAILAFAGCERTDEPKAKKEEQPESSAAVENIPPPTVGDARDFMERLDAATKDFDPILQKGDIPSLAKQSRRMIALMDEGQRFGASAFEKPFGYCFSSGIHAREWWSVLVGIATTGKEITPNAEKDMQTLYLEHRKACLDAIAGQEKA